MGCFQPKLVFEEPKSSATGKGPVGLWKNTAQVTENDSPERRLAANRLRRGVSAESVDGKVQVYYYAMDEEASMEVNSPLANGLDLGGAGGGWSGEFEEKIPGVARELFSDLTHKGRGVYEDGSGAHQAAKVLFPILGGALGSGAGLAGGLSGTTLGNTLAELLVTHDEPKPELIRAVAGRKLRNDSVPSYNSVPHPTQPGEVKIHSALHSTPHSSAIELLSPGDHVTVLDKHGVLQSVIKGLSWTLPLLVAALRMLGEEAPDGVYSGEITGPFEARGVNEKYRALKERASLLSGLPFFSPKGLLPIDVARVAPGLATPKIAWWSALDAAPSVAYAADASTNDDSILDDMVAVDTAGGDNRADENKGGWGSELYKASTDLLREMIGKNVGGIRAGGMTACTTEFLNSFADAGYTSTAANQNFGSYRQMNLGGASFIPWSIPTAQNESSSFAVNAGVFQANRIVGAAGKGPHLSWGQKMAPFQDLLGGAGEISVLRTMGAAPQNYDSGTLMMIANLLLEDQRSDMGTSFALPLIRLLLRINATIGWSGENPGCSALFSGGVASAPMSFTFPPGGTCDEGFGGYLGNNWTGGAMAANTVTARYCNMKEFMAVQTGATPAVAGWTPELWNISGPTGVAVIPIHTSYLDVSGRSLVAWASAWCASPLWKADWYVHAATAGPGTPQSTGNKCRAWNVPEFIRSDGPYAKWLFVSCDRFDSGLVPISIAGTNVVSGTNGIVAGSQAGGADPNPVDLSATLVNVVSNWQNNQWQCLRDHATAVSYWGRLVGNREDEQLAMQVVSNYSWVYFSGMRRYLDITTGVTANDRYTPTTSAALTSWITNQSFANLQTFQSMTATAIGVPLWSPVVAVARASECLVPQVGHGPVVCVPGFHGFDGLSNTYIRSLVTSFAADLFTQQMGIPEALVLTGIYGTSTYQNILATILQAWQGRIMSLGSDLPTTIPLLNPITFANGNLYNATYQWSAATNCSARVPAEFLVLRKGLFHAVTSSVSNGYTGAAAARYQSFTGNTGQVTNFTGDVLLDIGCEEWGSPDAFYSICGCYYGGYITSYVITAEGGNNLGPVCAPYSISLARATDALTALPWGGTTFRGTATGTTPFIFLPCLREMSGSRVSRIILQGNRSFLLGPSTTPCVKMVDSGSVDTGEATTDPRSSGNLKDAFSRMSL